MLFLKIIIASEQPTCKRENSIPRDVAVWRGKEDVDAEFNGGLRIFV